MNQLTAWANGVLGILLSFLVGLGFLGLSEKDIALSIVVSIVAGLLALLATTRGGVNAWIRRHIMPNPLTTWIVFLSVYFGTLLIASPALREMRVFGCMIVPLIMCTGFAIIAFGPIQDRFVNRMLYGAARRSKGSDE